MTEEWKAIIVVVITIAITTLLITIVVNSYQYGTKKDQLKMKTALELIEKNVDPKDVSCIIADYWYRECGKHSSGSN